MPQHPPLRRFVVSIHAPRVGGDTRAIWPISRARVSIHAPRVGGDSRANLRFSTDTGFQSTPPAWGATRAVGAVPLCARVSIHAPRVGGDVLAGQTDGRLTRVSIHAPRVGGDAQRGLCFCSTSQFQSTPPAWGATTPLAPHHGNLRFQSTPPAWGATIICEDCTEDEEVSIHAPRVGGDISSQCSRDEEKFQSTPPAWGATQGSIMPVFGMSRFNPRPPRGGRPKQDRSPMHS